MAIFNIDEMINDPWAGLRNTDAYHKYVLEEVKRLFKSGAIEEVPKNDFIGFMYGYQPDDYDIPTFIFDGREFEYMYGSTPGITKGGKRIEVKMIDIRYKEWDAPMLYVPEKDYAKWRYE